MAEPFTTRTLEAKCFCGSVHFTIDAPVSSLPFPVHLCHCSLCRWATGALCVFHTPLHDLRPNFVAPSSEASLSSYTAPGNRSSLLFCSTCGCHITCTEPGKGWVISTSIFAENSPDVFQIRKHIYSKSAKDGGLAAMLTHVGDRELGDYNPPPENPRSQLMESVPEVDGDGRERLRAQCHCGGVSFTFGRPTQGVLDDEFLGSYVSPVDKTKWPALLDTCDDCRLVSGTHVSGWAFVPRSSCEPAIGPDLQIGTSKTFVSSAGVLRSFCGTCGATVLYTCDDRRPDEERQVLDVAVGLLRAPEGPMAEKWLTWRSKIAHVGSGRKYDGDFAEAMQKRIDEYVVRKHRKELTFDIK